MRYWNSTKYKKNANNNYFVNEINSYRSKYFYKEKILLHHSLLLLKVCLLGLAVVSLVKVGYISKVRVNRLREIKNSYFYEKDKFTNLSSRFDDLFSMNGEQRFMKDQYQMISRDILRVIWR